MKSFLQKMLAMAVIAAMVGSVACNKYDDDIDGLNNRLNELEGKVALKADFDALKSTVDALNAIDFGSFATDAELQAAIAKCASKEDIAQFLSSEDIKALIAKAVEDMTKVVEEADGKLQQQIDAVDGAVKGLDAAFKAFDAWTKVQGNVQAAIAEALKPYLLAEDALTIAEVNAAIAEAVKDALTVEDVEKTIEAWMGANFAKLIEPYNTSIATDLQAEQNARKAADEKLQADLEKQLAAAKQALEEADKTAASNLQKEVEALEQKIEEAKKAAAEKDAEILGEIAKVKEANNSLKTDLQDAIADAVEELEGKIEALDAVYAKAEDLNKAISKYDEAIQKIEEALKKLQEKVDDLEEAINALIQNITYVPDYADGKATAVRLVRPIPGATTLAATTLTAEFDITPAEAAKDVVAMWGDENEKTSVYMKIQPVQSRAAAPIMVEEAQLTVALVEGVEGRIKVTAKVKDMPEDYNSYMFAFCVKNATSEAASDYEGIVFDDVVEYGYAWVNAEGKSYTEDARYDEETGWMMYGKKWTEAADSGITFMEGYELEMVDAEGKHFAIADIEKQYNLVEGALTPKLGWSHLGYATGDALCLKGEQTDLTLYMISENPIEMMPHIGCMNVFQVAAFDAYVPNVLCAYEILGSKVENGTYYIEEAGDLYWLSKVGQYEAAYKNPVIEFAEGTTFDMAAFTEDYEPIHVAYGVINGNNAVVKNLTVEGTENVGVFGSLIANISNLKVMDSKISGNHWVGAIAGTVYGNITNCDVENVEVLATPNEVSGAWDNGDKAGAVIGYLPSNDAAGQSCFAIEGCDVVNAKVTAFRDVAGIVGAANTLEGLIKNNSVTGSQILADQRASQWPGYVKDANVGYIIGRQLTPAEPYDYAATNNTWGGTTLKVLYAEGAEHNLTNLENPVLELKSANGLAWFSNNVQNPLFTDVQIMNDIDFGGKMAFEEATFKPINNWNGQNYRAFSFNGNGYTISNFTIESTEKDQALFGSFVGDIKNVKMNNVEVTGLGRVAGIAAQLWGNIDNCSVTNGVFTAVVTNNDDGDKVGAIVAQMQDPNTITNCVVDNVEINGYRDMGAIAGMANIAAWDGSNKVTNTTIWIDQTMTYAGTHTPFANESEYVGRQTGVEVPADAGETVNVYNIVYSDLGREFTTTADGSARLNNAAAFRRFAEVYKNYSSAFLSGPIALEGEWTPIGDSFANAYQGTFDGRNYPITGLKVTKVTENSGLFGVVRGAIKNVYVKDAEIYGSHWAAVVVATMYGPVEGCTVEGGQVIVSPNQVGGVWDNGDKAAALVGYLAANGAGDDKVINNKVDGVKVKAFRDLGALVGCANNIDAMSGNIVTNNVVIVDQLTGHYEGKAENIGKLVGRLDETTSAANVSNNDSTSTMLYRVNASGTQALAADEVKEIGTL